MRTSSSLLGLIPFLLLACSKSPDHTAAIPKESDWVAAYDLQAIAEKAELNKSSEYRSFQMMQEEMKTASPELQKMLQAFLKDPLSLGIDLSQEVYSFHYAKGKKGQGKIGLIAAISDRGKLRSNVDKLLASIGPAKIKVREEKGRSYLSTDGSFLMWDGSRMLFLTSLENSEEKAVKAEADRLMGLKGEGSLMNSNKDFQKFMGRRKDISNWISFKKLPEKAKEELAYVPDQAQKGLNNSTMHSYLAFRSNEIEFVHFTNNEKWPAEKLDKFVKEGLDKKLMSFFPKKAYMGFSTAFKPDAVYELVKEKGGKSVKEAEEEMQDEQGIELKKVMKSLSGDLLLAVNGFDSYERTYMDFVQKGQGDKDGSGGNKMGFQNMERVEKTKEQVYPELAFLIKTRTPYIKKQIEKKLLKNDSVEAVGDHYRVGITDFPMFLGWKKNKIMIASHEEAVKKLYDGGFSPSLADSDMGSLFAGSAGSASMLLDLQEYPEKVREWLMEGMMGPSKKAVEDATGMMRRIDMQHYKKTGFKVTFKLKEGEGNSLGRLLQKADDKAGTIMRTL